MPNSVKDKLRRGERALGLSFGFACAPLVEVGALLGFDFTYLDAEHGTISPRECEDLVRAADCRQSPTICRVGTSDPQVMQLYDDTGDPQLLAHARRLGDVLVAHQSESGLWEPRPLTGSPSAPYEWLAASADCACTIFTLAGLP